MDLNTLYHRTVECWADRVNAVADDQWDCPTPCTAWTVRDLVNHVVGEDRWTKPLVDGRTIAEVGDSLDGDLLGDDPVRSALDAAKEATMAVAQRLPENGTVHLSYGEEQVAEYVHQLAADHLVHAWDLAVATGQPSPLDAELASRLHEVALAIVEPLRGFAYAAALPALPGDDGDGEPGSLLRYLGRDPHWAPRP